MPDGVTPILAAVIVLAIVFDYINGFHDTANAIATSVSTRALRPAWAIAMSATAKFGGALVGTAVAQTISGGIIDPNVESQTVIAAALVGAIFWNLFTWRLGIPSSSQPCPDRWPAAIASVALSRGRSTASSRRC